MTTYEQFIENKKVRLVDAGFSANLNSKHLFPFQNHVVNRSLKAGKFAVFSGTGTGKTRMQLSWANEVANHVNGFVLVLCPLAVKGQTIAEGKKIHIVVQDYFEAVNNGDINNLTQGIVIANYDQLDNIDCSVFKGIALDEASILKNHEGAYRNKLIEEFRYTEYKSVWTATPSPNDPMEIGNYSEFLNVMPRNEMLAMYFVHDGGETSKWRLKGHSKSVFWQWVSSWATMFQNPSDIGFEQSGYDLPPLNLIEKKIITEKRNNGSLFNDTAVSATNFNQELRLTMDERLKVVADIVNNSTENFIIWIKQNEEGAHLRKLISGAIEVSGSDENDYKEEKLLGFGRGDFRVLITKTKIAGMGLNYQNCHNQIFASPDFSFEGVFQGIRRSWRFGQEHEVTAYIVTTDTMDNVIKILQNKQLQFDQMQKEMTEHMNADLIKEKIERIHEVVETENFRLELGDCVQLIKNVPDESIGLSVFSPPFADLYVYSDQVEDMGNSKDYQEFLVAFRFLVKELYRVLYSGRNVAVHCMDLPIQKGKEGYIGLRDFSGMIRQAFEDVGFIYHCRTTIWRDPVTEMQRTKALGLLHKQVKKDSAMSRTGLPDYILVFRKPGEHLHPVTNTEIPVSLWQQYASPVWMDIDYGDTLNYRGGRAESDEKHICALQLPTVQRIIHLWSNPDDIVLTPFAGIGTEVYKAIEMGRKGIGFELKKSYFDQAVLNCNEAVIIKKQDKLF